MSRKSKAAKPWHDGDVTGTLALAEGLLSDLRDKPAEQRPTATPQGYLMRHYRCSKARMQARIADAEDRVRRRRPNYELAETWLETLRLIADELGEQLYAKTYAIAHDVTNRNAFPAQKFLLEKIEAFSAVDAQDAGGQAAGAFVGDIEQEVFDEMNDDEDAMLAEMIEVDTQNRARFGRMVQVIRKRIADRRVSDSHAETSDADE